MKIKKLLITTSFIFLAATTTFNLSDANSQQMTKIVLEDETKNLSANIPIIAHRGFSSIEIENSKEAITAGFNTNCTIGVEIDLHMTKDNKIVISHDDKINNKIIANTTLGELKKEKITHQSFSYLPTYLTSLFDNKSGNLTRERIKELQNKESKIITLDEALNIHDEYQEKKLIVELKFDEREKEKYIDILYEKIKKHDTNNIVIQSNDYEALLQMKEKYPDLEYHLIVRKDNYNLITKKNLDGYVIRKNLINYNDVKILLENNKKVSVWTINTYDEYQHINTITKDLSSKISYITDYPDALRTWNYMQHNDKKVKIKK